MASSFTVTVHSALKLSSLVVVVMVAVPAATEIITPSAIVVAVSLFEVHFTVVPDEATDTTVGTMGFLHYGLL